MRGTPVTIGSLLFLLLCAACAGGPRIQVDEHAGVGRYATWDWISRVPRTIDASGSNVDALDRELAQSVECELAARGFSRDRQGADLRIGVVLDVRREIVTVLETGSVQQLSSLHYSPSFQVQSMVERKQLYEFSRLVVFAVDPRRARIVWRGVLEQRFRGEFAPHVARTVSELLARFPPPHRGDDPQPRRGPQPEQAPLLSFMCGGSCPALQGPQLDALSVGPSSKGQSSKPSHWSRIPTPNRYIQSSTSKPKRAAAESVPS